VAYAQSHGTWWSAEFQARAIEGRYAVARRDNKLTRADVQRALAREFPEEVEKHGIPSEQQVRNWAKRAPNLPQEMRKKGGLGGVEALQYQSVSGLNRAEVPALPSVPGVGWGVWPYTVPEPVFAARSGVSSVFAALTECMVACLIYYSWQLVGLGHLPLKEEITSSNPVCATN